MAACIMSGVSGCATTAQSFALLLPRTGSLRLESILAQLCFSSGPGFSFVALLAVLSSRRVELLAGVTFLLFELAQRFFWWVVFVFFLKFAPSVRVGLHRSQYNFF